MFSFWRCNCAHFLSSPEPITVDVRVDNIRILPEGFKHPFIKLEFELELYFDGTKMRRDTDYLYLIDAIDNQIQNATLTRLKREFVYNLRFLLH